MTTTASERVAHPQRVLPMQIPHYSYQYPSHMHRIQLGAAKEGIFHPHMPSLRQIEMDTTRQRMPADHCQTTTMCRPDEFNYAVTSLFTPAEKKLQCVNFPETVRQLRKYYATPDELKRTRLQWSDFLNRAPERFNSRLPHISDEQDLRFSGYAVRYMRPELTSSWRYSLPSQPTLDHIGQKPIASSFYDRYRSMDPTRSYKISNRNWH